MKKIITTHGFEETQSAGVDFAQTLTGGNVLALHGDLGSGKTTFVQGLAKGLGITGKIISPTFIIVRTYEIERTAQRAKYKNFYHVDLYRIENEKDVEGLGLKEIMGDPENIVAIEWPEKIAAILPKDAKELQFRYLNDDTREITV